MQLTNHKIEETEKKTICSWKYDGAYAMYNLPSYEEMKQKQMGFCNPQKEQNFYTFYDQDLLVGFVNILEEEQEVFIGIGANPFLCGEGYGQQMLRDAYQISKKMYPDKPLYLEVRSWNERAVKCYKRAGFLIDGAEFEQTTPIGTGIFYRMIKA